MAAALAGWAERPAGVAWCICPAISWHRHRANCSHAGWSRWKTSPRLSIFGPRIADIPDALMARIMALKPIVSLNRQEAQIALSALAWTLIL
ncbi:putative sugar kinase [Enterobacter cloacae]|uniref:Putative sugar kinase n=1 Tax=Enterobacter cloacae TaxID=550 RepID=A0A377LXV5_ENTCL|nr:putative sugar kinase [Enterobacter cloacae]